jgi:thiamine monophosphate synthase
VKPVAAHASFDPAPGAALAPLLVAIGGIDPTMPRVITPADAVAVITALFGVPDTFAAARAFSRLFQQPTMPAL